MKKLLVLSALCNYFFIISVSGQTGEIKAWTPDDRSSFIVECINSAKVSMGVDSSRYYCYCMQEKMEIKYPDVNDAAKITADDMKSPEWLKEVKSCLYGTWSKDNREEFVSNCIKTARESLGETKSKSYCECMLFKMEKIYPNADDAAKITADDLKSDRWQKILKGCLAF